MAKALPPIDRDEVTQIAMDYDIGMVAAQAIAVHRRMEGALADGNLEPVIDYLLQQVGRQMFGNLKRPR